MARKPFVEDERRSYSRLFVVLSTLLVLTTGLAVVDEVWVRRPWKSYQAMFSRQEVTRLTEKYDEARRQMLADKEYETLSATIADLQEKTVEPELVRRFDSVRTKTHQLSLELLEHIRRERFAKSEYEAAHYDYRHALMLGRPATDLALRNQRLEDDIRQSRRRIEDLELDLKEAEDEAPPEFAELERLRAELARLRRPVERLAMRLSGAVTRRPSLRQIVVPGFERNEFNQVVDRVDRCTSCHLGVEDDLFRDAAPVFRTHPQRPLSIEGRESVDSLLGLHPPERFGCSSCHQGQGIATTAEDAHAWSAVSGERIDHWDDPLLQQGEVESSCNGCHGSLQLIPGAEHLNAGKKLFRILGCYGCHPLKGYEGLPKIGPSLRKVGSKVRKEWLVQWIEDPRALHRNARMPTYELQRDDALRIAAYLLASSSPYDPSGATTAELGDPSRGAEIVERVGCAGCHTIDSRKVDRSFSTRFDFAPELVTVASKVTGAAWIYRWLLDPLSYSATTRMPSLQLTRTEAADAAAHLAALGALLPPLPSAEVTELGSSEAANRGKELIRLYGCFGCHDINGFEEAIRIAPPLDGFASKEPYELDFGNTLNRRFEGPEIEATWDGWVRNKLLNPRIYATDRIDLRMPSFRLTDDEVDQLMVFMKSLRQWRMTETYLPQPSELATRLDRGELLIEHFNCRGCHQIRGIGGDVEDYFELPALAPPILDGEGKKVQSEWLFGFLKRPSILRPWLTIRMPTFNLSDDQASTLAEFFFAADHLRHLHDFVQPRLMTPEEGAVAKETFELLQCLSCHQLSSMDTQETANLAPDLALTPSRLKYDWVLEWIKDPQTLQPGTKMPAFFPLMDEDDPTSLFSPLPHILNGDAVQQIELLANHLFSLPQEEPGSDLRDEAPESP
jgi:cytochrome c551/c552